MENLEYLLGRAQVAVDDERQAFAECAMQALVSFELGEWEWGRRLLLTARAWGLGGPHEDDRLPEVEAPDEDSR